jgi:hypothetical protein
MVATVEPELAPFHEVYPLIGFVWEAWEDDEGTLPSAAIGVFLLNRGEFATRCKPDLAYTHTFAESGDDRVVSLGVYGPGTKPSTGELEQARKYLEAEREQS